MKIIFNMLPLKPDLFARGQCLVSPSHFHLPHPQNAYGWAAFTGSSMAPWLALPMRQQLKSGVKRLNR